MSIRRKVCWLVPVALAIVLAAQVLGADGTTPTRTGQARDATAADRLAEYGVTLAFKGDVARAESVFVTLLSVAPRDARALNNLGNLSLMKGESEVAMAFYARAAMADTADAGIPLNRSVALMLSGRDSEARAEAARAVEMAGGLERAGSFLALRSEQMAESKEAKVPSRTYLSKSEVMALLKGAKTAVPGAAPTAPAGTRPGQGATTGKADSLGAGATPASGTADAPAGTGPGSATAGAPATKPKSWRSAGLRASEFSEIATSLYWKM
jgi:tetratricopeptide (TPR) repeat protein